MSNRFEQVYGLTVLSPIAGGRELGIENAAAIRGVLAGLWTGEDSPFAAVPHTHTARWVVVDDVPNHGVPTLEDHLASKYLLFTSNFDGELDHYLDGMLDAIPEVLDALYGYCLGFPGVDDRRAFKTWMKRCQIDTTLLFGGYPGATVEQVLRALRLKELYLEFLERHQCDEPGDLKLAFDQLLARIEDDPTLAPGSTGGPS